MGLKCYFSTIKQNQRQCIREAEDFKFPIFTKRFNVACNAMTATIYSNKLLIGTAQLQIGDESMGGVFGEFFPNDNYYEIIQKFVWDFWSKHKPDYQKWHSLRLNAQLENGCFLFPTGGYTIDDFKQYPDDPKRIDITGADVDALKFENDFLINPWKKINIEQKIGLEDELQKELMNTKKSFFGLTSKIRQHILLDTEFSAIATHGSVTMFYLQLIGKVMTTGLQLFI